jgi:hypothetical protein
MRRAAQRSVVRSVLTICFQRDFQSCVCPICREFFESKKFCQLVRSNLHKNCARCPTASGCDVECDHCAVDATCVAENAATPEQRAAIDRFDEAKATYEPHRALYKHQDEQYRLMKDNLTDDHAMIVFDFSPYNATALQLTQEESRRSGMQVLHVVVIRRSTKARSTTTTGVFRSFVRCHFHIFGTAGGNDLKFHYIDFVLESGSTNDYAFLKTALVRRRMSFVSSCVTI